jgi:hypothetical protein
VYIETTTRYYVGSEARIRKARFLILCQPNDVAHKDPMPAPRALVRKVALLQCGHFMIGVARAWGRSLKLSGDYGDDGLALAVPPEVYERAEIVPDELVREWNKGGGWNTAGSEREAMRAWALNTFKEDPI